MIVFTKPENLDDAKQRMSSLYAAPAPSKALPRKGSEAKPEQASETGLKESAARGRR